MPTIHYKKIVRDKVPEIIAAKGGKPESRVLAPDDFARLMRDKLVEESREVVGAQTYDALVSELADVAEVLITLQQVHGITDETLDAVRAAKAAERGGFAGRIFLESVEE